ncbi:CZB domain-containing protein [Sulfurivermis fontis]|uniref:CZB domain-containing protein n=1 Tax=Sulfurivermis fontis TaxID=1972068 RepID=UPI000FD98A85|nr:CZB domain-containing protein [Sulfurivermis fontis]
MDKKQVITHLRATKSAHIKWRAYAQAIVAGLPINEDQVPVIHTDCAFGKWYYGPGQKLSSLPGFQAIETPHEALHSIYMQIFKLLFETEEISFFQKLIGTGKKRDDRREQLNTLLNRLIEMSKTLLAAIELLEQEVLGMDEKAVAELI